MGSSELSKRDIWQDVGQEKAVSAEKNFFQVFSEHFRNSEFRIRKHPMEFKRIYLDINLSPEVLAEIYTPSIKITKHGVIPDYAIDNIRTQKTLYIEVKRQDGWVEGKERKAGRGNAHERSCKFFTPGLLKILRARGKLGDNVLPFWTVFLGDITRDPCRVREITCWYGGDSPNFFMWRNSADKTTLINHFEGRLKSFLS